MSLAPLDAAEQRRHKWRNTLHTWLLIGGSVALVALCAWLLWGPGGLIWAVVVGGFGVWSASRVSPHIVLRLYRAQELRPDQFPEGYRILAILARRAGLPAVPKLYYVASSMMNAFAVGNAQDAAIAVTDGLIRRLNLRQLTGVLAHEISHIRNGDLKVMAIADMVNRLTSVLSAVGLFMLFTYLPAILAGGGGIPWVAILLLMFAPTIGGLLQLALSRAREYDADLDAAGLTGDPEGLASALAAFERRQGRTWEGLMLPGSRLPDPSLLRTHPRTEDRIERLLSLRGEAAQQPPIIVPDRQDAFGAYQPVLRRPRIRPWGGFY